MTSNDKLIRAYSAVADYIKENCVISEEELANVEDSPERVAKGLMELVATREEVISELKQHLLRVFPVDSQDRSLVESPAKETTNKMFGKLIIQSPITTSGMCPHHFLPIVYRVTYAYNSMYVASTGKDEHTHKRYTEAVLGLSKLSRIAQVLARRPVIQEQYTKDLVDVLMYNTIANGFAILGEDEGGIRAKFAMSVVSGTHTCMKCRGVKSDSDTITTYFDGKVPDQIVNMVIQEHYRH